MRTAAVSLLRLLPWCLLAVPLSGAVRAATGLALPTSLALAVPIALLMAAATVGVAPPRARTSFAPFALLAIGLVVVSIWSLYDARYSGLPSTGGIDAANHVDIERAFVTTQPFTYRGMVTFYATVHWLERFGGIDTFLAFRAAYYAAICCLALLVVFIARRLADGLASTWSPWLMAGAVAWFAYWTFFLLILPLVGYYQTDGYYPQVFSIVPLAVIAYAYAVSATPWRRVAALSFGVLFLRFTYMLNLGDLLLASAILFAVEAHGARSRVGRLGAACVALAACVTGVVAYRTLIQQLRHMTGGFLATNETCLGLATLLSGVLVLLAPTLGRLVGTTPRADACRALRFCGLFAIVGALAQLSYSAAALPHEYYFHKYGFAPALLAFAALTAMIGWLAVATLASTSQPAGALRGWIVLAAIVGVSAGAVLPAAIAFRPYRWLFAQRLDDPHGQRLHALSDRRVWSTIDRVLDRTGKQFGGALLSDYIENQFTNSSFGLGRAREQAVDGTLPLDAGRCIFWTRTDDPERVATSEGAARLTSWLEADAHQCEGLATQTSTDSTLAICWVCFDTSVTSTVVDAAATDVRWSGVYEVEHEGRDPFRWTDGNARVALNLRALDSRADCGLRLRVHAPSGYSIALDGVELTRVGDRFMLPQQERSLGAEELAILSPTFLAPDDDRTLGVQLFSVEVQCLTPARTRI